MISTITEPTQKNKVSLFFRKKALAEKARITTLKNECTFLFRLFIACQIRGFFQARDLAMAPNI